MHRLAVILLSAGLLAGCVNQLAVRQSELARWVGQPEGQLIDFMGVPDKSYETGGVKYLAYAENRVEVIPSTQSYPFGPPFGAPYGWYGGGFPAQAINLSCETTFAIAGGVVRSFSLRGNACG